MKKEREHVFDVRSDVFQIVITIITAMACLLAAHCFTFFFSLIDQYLSRIFVAYLQFVCRVDVSAIFPFLSVFSCHCHLVILLLCVCVCFLGCQPIQSTWTNKANTQTRAHEKKVITIICWARRATEWVTSLLHKNICRNNIRMKQCCKETTHEICCCSLIFFMLYLGFAYFFFTTVVVAAAVVVIFFLINNSGVVFALIGYCQHMLHIWEV